MPNYTVYHQNHELEKVTETRHLERTNYDIELTGYHCKKCDGYWNTRPKKGTCLGMPRYQVRKNRPAHLFTLKELEKKHLQPASEPEGYVYVLNSPYWIFLYDINKATPLKAQGGRERKI